MFCCGLFALLLMSQAPRPQSGHFSVRRPFELVPYKREKCSTVKSRDQYRCSNDKTIPNDGGEISKGLSGMIHEPKETRLI